MTLNEWLTLAAIVIGPIIAVLVARQLEHRKERRVARYAVFSALMRTRRTPTFPDHVQALNLVELEFHDSPEVLAAYKALLGHLGTEHARRKDEIVLDGDDSRERSAKNLQFAQRLFDERQKLLAKMLHAIARRLRFKIEQLEIFEGGYTPQGWHDDEIRVRSVHDALIDVLDGRKPIAIKAADLSSSPAD